MKKKVILFSILFFIFFIIQYTIVPISFKNCGPDYMLVLVVCSAMFGGYKFGAVFGLIAGLFCDYADGIFFGAKAIAYIIFGYAIGLLIINVLSVNIFSAYMLFIVSFILSQLNCYQFYVLLGAKLTNKLFLDSILPQAAMTLPFVLIIFGFIRIFIRKERKATDKLW